MLLTLYAVVPTLYAVNITICYVLFKVYDVLIIIMMMMIVQILCPDVAHDIGVKRKVILFGTSEAMFYAMETA